MQLYLLWLAWISQQHWLYADLILYTLLSIKQIIIFSSIFQGSITVGPVKLHEASI